uniref:C-JID domain-containing protein n=1 Tax=Quercus lobata TaxID=97700 RepID=A0A7N2MKI6_QUELO
MFQRKVICFSFTIPGREIPKWFTHQSIGASMNLQVPSSLCNKLKGVVVCAIFVLRQHHPFPQHNSLFEWRGYKGTHELWCSLESDRFLFEGSGSFFFSEEFGDVESYHLFQNYHPIVQSFNEEQKEKLSQADVDIFTQIEIKFETDCPGLEVMKCGGRLIFEQDIEDLNQTMPRCSNSSSCSITPYEDDFEGSTKDTKTKRSRDDNDGTSGEAHKDKVTLTAKKRNPSESRSFDESVQLIICTAEESQFKHTDVDKLKLEGKINTLVALSVN